MLKHALLTILLSLTAFISLIHPEKDSVISRRLLVDDSHLLVPIGNSISREKKTKLRVGIYTDDVKIQDFRFRPPENMDSVWWASYPLSSFGLRGEEITLVIEDTGTVDYDFTSAFKSIRIASNNDLIISQDFQQPYRNQFHVSSPRGWNNDPNGMVYHEGLYHLYYQHNPFGIFWGNMHWGHATSTDLIHWKHRPIALFQKTVDDMAFSGGGFVDFNNSSGLGKNTLFVVFTSTGRGECLAYSQDGGLTFEELPENPVLKHEGRDPKVIWYEPEQKWVMIVYNAEAGPETEAIPAVPVKMKKKRKSANLAFYESRDLRNWTRTGAFTDPDRHAVFECPELFRLPVKGKPGEFRWILYGAQSRYFIGEFDGKVFHKESGPHGIGHGAFYAAQTFSQTPDQRRIQIGWVQTESYVAKFPNQIVNQALSLPHLLELKDTNEGLRLFYQPVKETQSLREELTVSEDDVSLEKANELLRNVRNELSEIIITFDIEAEHRLLINGIDASFTGKKARIFTDRTFNEIYVDDGKHYFLRTLPLEAFDDRETVISNGSGFIKSIQIYRLKSIWDK